MEKERKTVMDQMTMAEDELQKMEDLVKILSDKKTVCFTSFFFSTVADGGIYWFTQSRNIL